MTSANASNVNDDGTPILYPYMYNPNARSRRRWRNTVVIFLAIFSLFWGMVFAFMAPALIVLWIAPIAILALVAIWALPDLKTAPTRAVEGLFFAFTLVMGLWPDYLSISLHQFGLPWVSLERLISVPLGVIVLICISISAKFRGEISYGIRAQPVIWGLLFAWVVIQTYCIFLTPMVIQGLDRYVNMQSTWTLMFIVGAYVFTRPGAVDRWVRTIWAAAVIAGVVGVVEWRVHHVLWMGHLPGFLELDPQVAKTLTPEFRAYTSIYRVQSVFSTAIGFGEFISLTTPFILNYGLTRLWTLRGMAAVLTVPFLFFVALITNARSALIGLLLGVGAYGFYWAYMQLRMYPEKLLGKTLVLAYPIFAFAGFVSTFFIGRLHKAVWGGGEQQSSTLSRSVQYETGLPLVFKNPIGHGIGQAGVVLGFYTPDGMLTIDTYYLVILLEYGVIGFLVYYGLIVSGFIGAGRYGFRDTGEDKECSYLGAAGASLLAFLVIKSVFAQTDNHPLVFMTLGMVAALSCRVAKESSGLRAESSPQLHSPRPMATAISRARAAVSGKLSGFP